MERLKKIDKLTLKDMVINLRLYSALSDGLIKLPVPTQLVIKRKRFRIPDNMEEFTSNLCYGQRLFITRKEDNDFGTILRYIDGYYYPLYSDKKWDEELALLFGKEVLTCKVKDLYPTAMHLVALASEMIDREQTLLYREPSNLEKAAGIDKLNVFADLNSLHFLRDALKVPIPEVLLTPYNECLVLFMQAKEIFDYTERHQKLIREESERKSKSKYI
jgi:hypothetical protein